VGFFNTAGRFFATVERTFFQTQRLENRTYCSLLPEARSRSVWDRQAALIQQGVEASDHLLFPSQFVPTVLAPRDPEHHGVVLTHPPSWNRPIEVAQA
jgi:hypothetical protein